MLVDTRRQSVPDQQRGVFNVGDQPPTGLFRCGPDRGCGDGSPNYSPNAWLNIGQNYSITATPGMGFTSTNWIVSTPTGPARRAGNQQGVAVHLMASEPDLAGSNFVETNRPTLDHHRAGHLAST